MADDRILQKRKKVRNDDELFENLILEGDYLEYKPPRKEHDNNNEPFHRPKENINHLKEIYNEFWEFIDEDNPLFQRFIEGDARRK